ncbi:flagellar hook-associated protein FlgK [Halanaerobaculum tunisiense]
MSTFGGIEIGKRALQAQKKSLEVTGHNISNANTEGYSRQEVVQSATHPRNAAGVEAGQIGTGVKTSQIKRVRDKFIDGQIRKESSTQGRWEMKSEALKEIELIFNEPSDKGLRKSMSDFWNSMQELNNKPASKAVRSTVRQRALAVTDTFNHLNTQLNDYQASLNERINTKVEEVNSYADRIADLNGQIVKAESTGQDANDLRDKRNKLVSDLSKVTNIQVEEDSRGALRVGIGGTKLVSNTQVTKLETKKDSNDMNQIKWETGNDVNFKDGEIKGLLESRDGDINKYRKQLDNLANSLITEFNKQHQKGYGLSDTGMNKMKSEVQSKPTNPLDGKEGTLDVVVNGTSSSITISSGDNLSAIASEINGVANVNATTTDSNADGTNDTLEISGATNSDTINLINTSDTSTGEANVIKELGIQGTGAGHNFFQGSGAQDIDIASDIKGDTGLNNIAAATQAADSNGDTVNDYAGDGANALELNDLSSQEIMNSGTATLDDYYNSNISQLGVDTQRSNRMVSNQETLVKELNQQQQEVAGVSLDEEMSKMVKYQHSYTAASKVISTMDQMLQTLVNGVKR